MNTSPVLRLFVSLLVVAGLGLTTSLAHAQSSCSDCIGGGSDVSGVIVSGDNTGFSGSVQARVDAVATTLTQTLQSGSGVVPTASDDVTEVDARVAVLLTGSGAGTASAQAAVTTALTDGGLPAASAAALTDAVAGLLAGSRVNAAHFLRAVDAYNAAVADAPDAFVTAPPSQFVTLRTVLTSLLQSAAAE